MNRIAGIDDKVRKYVALRTRSARKASPKLLMQGSVRFLTILLTVSISFGNHQNAGPEGFFVTAPFFETHAQLFGGMLVFFVKCQKFVPLFLS